MKVMEPCDEGRLGAYIEESLDATELQRLREHLAHCPRCARKLAVWQRFKGAAEHAAELPPPAGFSARVQARIEESRAHRPWLEFVSALLDDWRWQAAAGSLALTLLILHTQIHGSSAAAQLYQQYFESDEWFEAISAEDSLTFNTRGNGGFHQERL